MVFGFTVTSVTIKIRRKGTRTHTKGYMWLVTKNIVVKPAKKYSDSVLRD